MVSVDTENFVDNTSQFFIITPLHFEEICLQELQTKWPRLQKCLVATSANSSETVKERPLPPVNIVPGGLEINATLPEGFLLNCLLKTPTRILLRISQFTCRDFPKLYQKMKKIPWGRYLRGQTPEFSISSMQSRLFDDRKISKTLQDGLCEYYRGQPPKARDKEMYASSTSPTIFLRFHNNVGTLSVDTSGKRLHMRSEVKLSSKAPLRENLAAGLLVKLREHWIQNSDLIAEWMLIDPMMGSGTFLMEAATFDDLNTREEFSFWHFPITHPYKGQMEKAIKLYQLEIDGPSCNFTFPFKFFRGSDIDEQILKRGKANLEKIKNKKPHTSWQILAEDLFADNITNMNNKNNIVITNPPYGIRIKQEGQKKVFFEKILVEISQKFNPHIMGIIIPPPLDPQKLQIPEAFHCLNIFPFVHGGLKVSFMILQKKFFQNI